MAEGQGTREIDAGRKAWSWTQRPEVEKERKRQKEERAKEKEANSKREKVVREKGQKEERAIIERNTQHGDCCILPPMENSSASEL